MSWQSHVKAAEYVLDSLHIPASEEIIGLIKKVNPTRLKLPEPDKKRGYDLKGRLQNLLLENYGEIFYLAPHPYDPEIVLIKHQLLPSIDACHADVKSLSPKALDVVDPTAGSAQAFPQDKKPIKPRREKSHPLDPGIAPKAALKMAQSWLEEYEYDKAQELLTNIRIKEYEELPTLVKAARILSEEMGAYDQTIETLLSQPKQIVKDLHIREVLALSYYSNGMTPEARAILESIPPAELGKDALYAYADISCKDGHLQLAFRLLEVADGKEGFSTLFAGLRKEIEERMSAVAEPVVCKARAEFDRGELEAAGLLAREALACYPNFQKARELIALMETMQTESEKMRLWDEFERLDGREERIELLGRLLECDKGSRSRIKQLMAAEKKAQKQEQVDDRLRVLRARAGEEGWSDCFDILHWLSGQEEHGEQYRSASEISPYFSVLYRNRLLQRLPEQSAKEIWLVFIEAKRSLHAGCAAAALAAMERIKPYFCGYPQFKDDYRRLRRDEQEKARGEIEQLLAEVRGEQCPCEANRVYGRMRGPLAALPAEERARYERTVEGLLEERRPRESIDPPLEEYRKALLAGDNAKAAALQAAQEDKEGFERIAAEVAELYRIEAEPLVVALSEDLEIDLGDETPSLKKIGITDRHMLLRDGKDAIIVLDLRAMGGVRYRSKFFRHLHMVDALPAKGIFLFCATENGKPGFVVWRAELAGTEGRFTASFDVREKYDLAPGETVGSCYLSSEDETDYYAQIGPEDDKSPGRFVKKNVYHKWNTKKTRRLDSNKCDCQRFSAEPDKFLVTSERSTKVWDEHLTCRGGSRLVVDVLGIDGANDRIYANYGVKIVVCNSRLVLIKEYEGACCGGLCDLAYPIGINEKTETVLFSMGAVGALYRLPTNEFSTKFSMQRIVCTTVPSTWYYFAYDRATSTMRLRDLTDMGELLEWEEMISRTIDSEDSAQRTVNFGSAPLLTNWKTMPPVEMPVVDEDGMLDEDDYEDDYDYEDEDEDEE